MILIQSRVWQEVGESVVQKEWHHSADPPERLEAWLRRPHSIIGIRVEANAYVFG